MRPSIPILPLLLNSRQLSEEPSTLSQMNVASQFPAEGKQVTSPSNVRAWPGLLPGNFDSRVLGKEGWRTSMLFPWVLSLSHAGKEAGT